MNPLLVFHTDVSELRIKLVEKLWVVEGRSKVGRKSVNVVRHGISDHTADHHEPF